MLQSGTIGSQESNLRSQGKNPGGVARQPGRLCGRSRMICEALRVSYAIPDVTGPRIDVDLCVSTYSTLKSSSILGAYDSQVGVPE